MRATLQSVVLPVAAWLLSAWVPYSKAAAVSPVQKVLSMLEDMEFNGKKAMAAERVVYADYKVSVAAMVTQLEFQVTTAKSTIDELTAFIADADNTVAALSRSIAKLENDIAEKEGMKKDILAERAVQSAENNKQRVDAQESVDALEHAIQSLKSRANDVPQESLLQGIANKDPTLKNVLAGLSMLQESAVSAPAAAAYEFQSSSIIEMLEDLLVKFKDQLEEVMALETKQAHATALEVQHLTHAIESMNSELQSKIVMKGEKSADSAAANGKLASTKEDLAEAEKTLADLKAAFSVKTTTFEENQKVRKEELSAIKEASDIIGHKTVRKTYRDQIGFVQKHASFLQVSSAKSQVAKAHQNAITILKARAKALSSKNLASLVARISASPFGKVIDMIEGLLEKLKLQATGEAEHKAWCDDQLATNEQKRSRMQTDIAQLSASIETKEMAIAQGKKDLATVLGEISKLTKDMREMTEQRQKEKAENNKAVTDAEAGEAAMKQALEILNKFYSGQAALLQNGQLQAPEMAAYKGMQDEKSGVIGMMEVILSDFSRLITDTKASEMQAVEEYKQQMADMTSMKDKKEGEAASSRFLVFLAGRGDITGLQGELYEIQDELGEQLDVKVLHAGIPVEKQMEAVESRSSGKRMIVLATDVVESSVTMPDVDVVIDSCLHKRKQWSAELREYQLRQELITKDEALQRRGRTGRLGPGEVYRLVTKQEFRRLVDHALPQMQTASISEVLLLLSDSPLVKDPREFLLEETLSPPAPRQVDEAMVKLQELGALEPQSGGLKPTNFGRMLQKLPLEPELGLLVWTGLRLGELEACEIMAGLVQRGLPFLSDASFPPDAVQQLVRLRRACSPDSDLLAGLRVYEAWQAFLSKTPQPTAAEEAQWCWSHYLSLNVLQEIEEMRTQIHNALAELGLASKIEDSLLKKMRERRRAHRQLTQTPKHQWLQDPAASLTKLLPPLSSQRPRHQLLRWCIALAFAANAVEVTGVECREVIYKCRKRKTRELDSFLRHQLYLRLQSSPVQLPKGDVRVSFADAEEAQIAIQMGNVAGGWYFPYSQAPRLAGNMAQKPRNAYAGAGMILGSESVCAPPVSPPAAVVAASVLLVQGGKGGNHFVCSKLTLLPQPLLAAVLAARPSAYLYGTQVGVQLKGEKECCEIDPRLLNVLETVRKLHRGEVAGASDTSTQQVRAAVQKLMTAAEEIARESVPLPTIKRNLQDIPASRFGRIIGKGGSNIQALQKANPKVRIHVPKASEGGSISVEGPEDAVTMACLAIRASL